MSEVLRRPAPAPGSRSPPRRLRSARFRGRARTVEAPRDQLRQPSVPLGREKAREALDTRTAGHPRTFEEARFDCPRSRRPSARSGWAHLGSNQGPPACEAGALPLATRDLDENLPEGALHGSQSVHLPGTTPATAPLREVMLPAGAQLATSPILVKGERVARSHGHRRSRSPLRENVSELATKRTLTITEAAELTGLSRKAIARRVERGSIRSVLRSGRRSIPRSELARVGLLPHEGYSGVDQLTEAALSRAVAGPDTAGGEQSLLEALVRELLDRVQRQAGELAQYKALTAEAETLRLEREVADLRLRLSALEGGATRLALQPGPPEDPQFSSARPGEQPQRPFPADPLDDSLWLPPQAASRQPRFGRDRMGAPLPVSSPAGDSRVSGSRILLLAVELLFIGLAAFLAWLADLGPVLAATTVAIAWLLAATLELVRWRSLKNQSQLDV